MIGTNELLSNETSKELWNRSYQIKASSNLWGEAPVPWVPMSIERFKADDARIVLDLPCGDGRNVFHLAAALPFLVGADASQNALSIAKRFAGTNQVSNVILQQTDILNTG